MIGKALKYMRRKNNYKQDFLAKKLNIRFNTLSQYETESRQPTFKNIEEIANTCDFDIFFVDRKDGEKFKVDDLERKDC